MVFSSTLFLFLFLPLTLMIYYNPFVRSRKFRNRCLLVASLFFYAWGEPFFVWLMVLSIAVGWACGRAMERAASRRQEKRILTAGVVFHVGLLFVFKYLTFVVSQLGLLLHEDFSAIHIALPIGISFFTFQLLSYLFDIYYGRSKAQQSVLAVGLYIALFPQIIAGPIVRYETIEQQIEHRVENIADFSSGMMCFIYGLGKKVVIANYMGVVADNIFDGAAASRSRRPGMARLPIRCRFTLIFPGTAIWRSVSDACSGSTSWRTSIIRISRGARRSSGGGGISPSALGSATMSISRWAATGSRGGVGGTISSLSGRSRASGTVRTGRSFAGASGTSCCCSWRNSPASRRNWAARACLRAAGHRARLDGVSRQGSRHGGELHRRDAGDGVRRHCGCDVLLLSHQFLFRVCGSRFAFPAHRSLSAEEGGVPARGAGSRDRYFCALARADREFLVQSVHLFQFLRNR